jgi:Gluconolactonase
MGRSADVSVEVLPTCMPMWARRRIGTSGQTLLFVDLTAGVVFRYDRSGVKLGSFPVGQEVGAVVPRRGGGLVLACATVSPRSDTGEGFELTAPVERISQATG